MARGDNPFYYGGDTQLGSALGATLGKALFGDPEAAAQLALRKAQMQNYSAQADEARAHAGLYGSQKTDQDVRTGYRQQFGPLGQTFVQLMGGDPSAAPPPAAAPADPLAPLPDATHAAPVAAPVDTSSALARAIIPMIMAAGGTQENPNIGDMVGGVTAMLGNDELARRGMVAQGKTPGKEFALTPDRADDIAQQGYTADFNKGTAVARIDHATDIPVANIRAGADLGVARINHATDIPVANIQAGAKRDVASLGKTIGFSLVSDVLPGAQMTGGERTPERNAEVGGAPGSYHLPNDGVEAFDVAPGTGARNFADAKAAMQAKYGSRLVEAIDETNTPGHGPHWHFAIADAPGGKAAAPPKPPKPLSAASSKMIDDEIARQVKASGWAQTPDAGTTERIREAAIANYQRTGNPATAVSSVLTDVKRRFDAKQAGGDIRAQAMSAINRGADPAAVRARYKKMTGKDLG